MTFPVQLYLPAQGANGDENLTYSMAAELISLLDDMNIWDIHRCRGGKCMYVCMYVQPSGIGELIDKYRLCITCAFTSAWGETLSTAGTLQYNEIRGRRIRAPSNWSRNLYYWTLTVCSNDRMHDKRPFVEGWWWRHGKYSNVKRDEPCYNEAIHPECSWHLNSKLDHMFFEFTPCGAFERYCRTMDISSPARFDAFVS